jgi:hypothetical protein
LKGIPSNFAEKSLVECRSSAGLLFWKVVVPSIAPSWIDRLILVGHKLSAMDSVSATVLLVACVVVIALILRQLTSQ